MKEKIKVRISAKLKKNMVRVFVLNVLEEGGGVVSPGWLYGVLLPMRRVTHGSWQPEVSTSGSTCDFVCAENWQKLAERGWAVPRTPKSLEMRLKNHVTRLSHSVGSQIQMGPPFFFPLGTGQGQKMWVWWSNADIMNACLRACVHVLA